MQSIRNGLCVMVVALLLFAAFGSIPVLGEQPVSLQYYSLAWQPGVVKAVRAAVKAWNEANPDIQVEIVWGSWAAANEFLLTSFLGGDAPDVFHQDAVMCYEYGTMGFAEPLDSYITLEERADIAPWMWESASDYEGTTYGFPFLVETHAVFYNRALFATAGIDVPSDHEVSWEQLVEYAQRLTTRDETGEVRTWGLLASVMEKFPWMLVLQNGGRIVHRNDDGTWFVEVDERAEEALRYYCDLVTKWGVMPPDAISSDYTYLMNGFAHERYAMIIYGCWNRRILVQWDDVDWGILHLQGPVNNITSAGPQAHGIWAGSKHKDEAARFLHFLSNRENVVNISYPDWIFPARDSGQENPLFGQPEHSWDLAKSWLVYSADVLPRMPTIIAFDMRIVVPEIEQVMLGTQSFEDAIAAINRQGNDYLKKTGLQ